MVIKYGDPLRREKTLKPRNERRIVGFREPFRRERGTTFGKNHVKNEDTVRRRDEERRFHEPVRTHIGQSVPSLRRDRFLVIEKDGVKRNSFFHQDGNEGQYRQNSRETIIEPTRGRVSVYVSSQNPLRDFPVTEDKVSSRPTVRSDELLDKTIPDGGRQPVEELPQTQRPERSRDGQNLPQHEPSPKGNLTERTKIIRKVHAIARELYGDVKILDGTETVPAYVYYTRRMSYNLFGKERRRELTDDEWKVLLEHLEKIYRDYVESKRIDWRKGEVDD